ncbi:inositol 2-dehydrogenase [Gynuella sp.]|uniref:inositol 2-dehydrogenase n=1 Tax=Gynuella sp. TaxID=2969146 RepID=UPI003D0BCC73
MINLAIFGTGRIGTVHALNAAANPEANVKYLVDPVRSHHMTELAKKTAALEADVDTVFADEDVHGIVIASSTDSHADLLMRAARAGKAVFCEKPISLDFATTISTVESLEQSDIRCMMGFQRRYDPDFRTLKERLSNGTAGHIEQILMISRDPFPPPIGYIKRSGGMFLDQSIHDLDMARYLLGEEIKTVYAVGNCLENAAIGDAGDIDTAMITLTSISGRFVQISNSRRSAFGLEQRVEVLCSKEVLSIGNRGHSLLTIADHQGLTSSQPENHFIDRFAWSYRAEMQAFIELIETGTPALTNIRDGLEAQRLAVAALESMHTGNIVELER